MANEQQVYLIASLDSGTERLTGNWGGKDDATVPKGMVLVISTLTFNFFPKGTGTLGRAGITGRDSAGVAVWRLQNVFMEPKKTLHLPFPAGLRLEAGGSVELTVTAEEPGSVTAEANGLLSAQSTGSRRRKKSKR